MLFLRLSVGDWKIAVNLSLVSLRFSQDITWGRNDRSRVWSKFLAEQKFMAGDLYLDEESELKLLETRILVYF